ncbi:MAG TPA: peptidase E [Solirubrobacteraceae bacterium]|jgi:dipeptidase E|nr:peptidase E [Solirubrobacteraceae bacterium]
MGGGGFTAGAADPALDDLVLRLTGVARPRVCLLPTAGGDSEAQIRRFYETYQDRLCEPTHISLFRLGRRPVPLREHLLAQDAIYVGGGSMVNLLAIWRAQGLDAILRDAWRVGVVLAGLSAGSMCWFACGVTTSSGQPAPAPGLGFLPGSNSVHHDSEPARRPVFLEAVRDGKIPPGWAVDDGAALRFHGTALAEVVSSRPHARAYAVDTEGERPLEPRVLERADARPATIPAVAELRRVRLARAGGLRE